MIEEYLKSGINHITMKRALSNLEEYTGKDLKYWKQVKRKDIHCLKGGYCFRTFVDKKYKSASTKNNIILQLERFFSYMIMKNAQENGEFLDNPVIKKWDKFNHSIKVGTVRKAIDIKIIKRLKEILMEEDFAFVRNLNKDFKDGVYSPSRGVILFLLLTYPLRSMQCRLLDNGREHYKEGLVQKIYYSGVDRDKKYALYINTNKSGEGYYIPWVDLEILSVLEKQYLWNAEYGDISVIKKYINKEDKKINPLFLTWDKGIVSRESLMKLWRALCEELYKRDGVRVESDLHSLRVSLVSYGLNIVDVSMMGVWSGQDSKMVNHYYRYDDLRSLVDNRMKLLEEK